MRYFVCLALGVTIAGMIRIGVPRATTEEVEPLRGISFRSWEPPHGCMDERVELAVLVEPGGIWVRTSWLEELVFVPRAENGQDWGRFEAVLRAQKASVTFQDRDDLHLAFRGTDTRPITHGMLVSAMAIAHRVGFVDVVLTPPERLPTNGGSDSLFWPATGHGMGS